jgi:hypothetical protein
MRCNHVQDEVVPVIPDWLSLTQSALFLKWSSTTRHKPGAAGGTWACEIYHGCKTCNEHLSLPCSLLAEANEIGSFLSASCYSDAPEVFLRFYLILLSEFVGQLEGAAELMGLKIGKKPRQVCLWANRWGKHRMQILLQHHPLMAFADQYGGKWAEVELRFRTASLIDACGNTQPARIIDTEWLARHQGNVLSDEANSPGRAVILVPPMMSFLEETMKYFRVFVDACLKVPDTIRKFESSAFVRGC